MPNIIRLPILGEEMNCSIKYKHEVIVTQRKPHPFCGFSMDMLRYCQYAIHPSSVDHIAKRFTSELASDFAAPIKLIHYGTQKTYPELNRNHVFGIDRWHLLGFNFEFAHESPTLPLMAKLRYRHWAVARPIKADDAYKRPAFEQGKFPLRLMADIGAYPAQENDSGIIERLLNPVIQPEPEPFILMKYSFRPCSSEHGVNIWKTEDWDKSGWDLQPITIHQFHDVRESKFPQNFGL